MIDPTTAVIHWLMDHDSSHLDLPALEDYVRRPAWQTRAACRGMGTAEFVVALGGNGAAGKAVCDGCLVRAECLDFAMADPELQGVWGGTTT
jgi:WhiB family transcriptional regulator, redox-sensing transcriptional regulator